MNFSRGLSVYCLRRGVGFVHSVDPSLVYVRFGDKTIAYSISRLAEPEVAERTLYYHNPVTVAPPADAAKWAALKGVIENVAKLVKAPNGN